MFELDRVRGRTLPPASIAVGVLTAVLFAVEVVRFGPSPGTRDLFALGASEHEAVWVDHQLWRLVCPVFLHANLLHIALNGYSFFLLAPFVEKIWGSARFLVVYVLTGAAGAALSSHRPGVISVGASGALFGLAGFLLAAAYLGGHRHEVRTIVRGTWGQGLFVSLGLTFAYGLSPGASLDNMAHLGGLLAGGATGLLLVETGKPDGATVALAVAAALAIVGSWGAFIFDARESARFEQAVASAESAFDRGDFAASAQSCEQALVLRPHDRRAPRICLLEGIAELEANRLDEASYALERAWRTEATPEAALFLVEVNVRKKDAKAARSWAQTCRDAASRPLSAELREELGRLARLPVDPETRAAIAAIGSG
jgi:rhomboid protease GluP